MKTDQLINTLANDPWPSISPAGLLLRSLPVALAVSAASLALTLGFRHGWLDAMSVPLVALKWFLPLFLGLFGLAVLLRLVRPGANASTLRHAMWLVPAGAMAAMAYAYATTPAAGRWAAFVGESVVPCLISIPLLSLPILAAILLVLRHGAVLYPVKAGAIAGLTAGGLGTAIYALHCTEDSPLFFTVWYSAGIMAVTALGAVLGNKLLRW